LDYTFDTQRKFAQGSCIRFACHHSVMGASHVLMDGHLSGQYGDSRYTIACP
jgi:hypothetical protein